jgi:glucose-1-phosphate cytidylyltransferase
LIDGDQSSWESSPLMQLAKQNQMMAFEHRGFWQPMDTLRDKNLLEDLWDSDKAPWKVWQ